jgi:hypothetical protein
MSAVRLPISGQEVILRPPTGGDDLILLEATALDTSLTLALVARLAQARDGSGDWTALCVPDLDALLLWLRQMLFGDLLRAEAVCPAAGCASRFDVSFSIGAYLTDQAPAIPDAAEPDREAGWYRLRGTGVRFRLPTGADQAALAGCPDPERELVRRCVQPDDLAGEALAQVEAAMAVLAPPLARTLQGACPECGAAVELVFDPQQFCLKELRDQAAFLLEDVAVLAERFHWSEADILALPRQRRMRYVELAHRERG